MRILYLGDQSKSANSYLRGCSLNKITRGVECFDVKKIDFPLYRAGIEAQIHYITGYQLLQNRVQRRLRVGCFKHGAKFDLVWINGGELFGRSALEFIKERGGKVLLYNNDDPTGTRDGNRWLSLRKALPLYDFCAVLREVNVEEYRARGVARVHRVWMSYDEEAHRPPEPAEITEEWRSEVAFIGTWMPERGPFMAALVRAGVPLSIWGNRWQKAPEWGVLKDAWRGPAVYGRDYARAVAGAKICLGLLSKGNRDLHTRRSVEVPFIGGLLCGERTVEHGMLYEENAEAVFWESAEECGWRCRELLGNPAELESIRRAGMARIRALRLGNEDVCAEILSALAGRELIPRPFHQPARR